MPSFSSPLPYEGGGRGREIYFGERFDNPFEDAIDV